jgi:segregation and condensation protein B
VEQTELKAIVENILLAADHPVTVDDLRKVLINGSENTDLRTILEELADDYRSRNLQIQEVAGGYQLCTRQEYTQWVRKFLKLDKTSKLSQPSLDTLSIIAYKQPLTRQEVEEIRGVDSSGVIKTLLERKIIGPAGRKKVPGRPIMYRTTQKFLEYFGLNHLSDLPTLEDFKEEILAEVNSGQGEINFEDSDNPPMESSESTDVDTDSEANEKNASIDEEALETLESDEAETSDKDPEIQ